MARSIHKGYYLACRIYPQWERFSSQFLNPKVTNNLVFIMFKWLFRRICSGHLEFCNSNLLLFVDWPNCRAKKPSRGSWQLVWYYTVWSSKMSMCKFYKTTPTSWDRWSILVGMLTASNTSLKSIMKLEMRRLIGSSKIIWFRWVVELERRTRWTSL
jgi:hypothetical protein